MLKDFSLQMPKGPVAIAKLLVGVLAAANLVAGYFTLYPPGGSPEELERQLAGLRAQLLQRTQLLQQTRTNAQTIERGRSQGDTFIDTYFLTARTASSTLVDELSRAAKEAKITPKEHSIQTEEIEGSDTLKMMTINGNYEGTYADLIEFINRLDRSERLMIIESLNATPQQGKGVLNINVKVDTFVRDEGKGL